MTSRTTKTLVTLLLLGLVLSGPVLSGPALSGPVLSSPVLTGRVATSGEPQPRAKWPYAKDMRAFIEEVDRTYPFFDIKGIRADWDKTKRRVLEDVRKCDTDQVFAELLIELGRCLRDAHLGPRSMEIEFAGPTPKYYPGVSFMPATDKRVILLAARDGLDADLKPGTIVTRIDGKDAREFLEARAAAAWKAGGFFSSPQRARMLEFRIPLQGHKGETHRITILAGPQHKQKELTLTADTAARGWPHTYNMPEGLTRAGRSCFYGGLSSGVGYIYLRRVDPSVEQAIGKALEAHPQVKGWIVDLRGNGGGGYGPTLQARLKTLRKPVACLIDAGCTSAGETLARDVVGACGARLFGSTTGGASSSKRTWDFPSGMGTMSLPTRSRWGIKGRAIEYYGIQPHVEVEAVPEEVQSGRNSCILRAEEFLLKGPAPREAD